MSRSSYDCMLPIFGSIYTKNVMVVEIEVLEPKIECIDDFLHMFKMFEIWASEYHKIVSLLNQVFFWLNNQIPC